MDPKLYEAAVNGDLKYLQDMTSQETSNLTSQLTADKDTVLHIATECHQTEFVRTVTQDCPSLLWQVNSSGDTALHIAARKNFEDIAKIFIDCAKRQRADVETVQNRELLKMVNSDGDTALHCAARLRNCRSVVLLVREDPEVCTFVNNANESPLNLSVASGQGPLILNVAPPSAAYKGANGLNALHPTLQFPNYRIEGIKKLVDLRKQMIREGDHFGLTPLHYAAYFGRTEAVKIFLQYDSSAIYVLDARGDSALHLAAFQGHVNTFKELINRHPDSSCLINYKGRTAFHAAVLGNQEKVVKFILKTPGLARLINKQDKDGNTPLHLAALFKFYNVIEIFAKNNSVNFYIQNKEFLTAIDVYLKLDEEGTRAKVTARRLCNSTGMGITYRDFALVRERLDRGAVAGTASSSKTTKDKTVDKDLGKQSALEINLLVATLVATVSFAAGFTMPGGYVNDGPNEGLATLTTKAAFQVFVVFNTIAFCCSVFAVFLHFLTSLIDPSLQVRNIRKTVVFTTIAIVAMVIAFSSGMCVVLTRSTALSITPYLISACFALLYLALPHIIFFSTMIPVVRNSLLSVEDFFSRLIELYGNT